MAKVRAPGRVESSRRTLIECEIESLSVSGGGSRVASADSTTILSIVPDGSTVREGDVLCELDATDYEELVRQQRDSRRPGEGRPRRFSARPGDGRDGTLREYRDGQLSQQRQEQLGRIILAREDVKRQEERVVWASRMTEIGYMPTTRLDDERAKLEQARFSLRQGERQSRNLDAFTAPKALMTLARERSTRRVRPSRTRSVRLSRHEDRLAHFQEQVELCSVRAPHDGFVIYANEDDGDTRIELGARVRRKQDLFFLPDLTRMEIQTWISQGVVDRVVKGQPAIVRVEALPTLDPRRGGGGGLPLAGADSQPSTLRRGAQLHRPSPAELDSRRPFAGHDR